MFHSELSSTNPRTGLKWAHGDELRCICGLSVRVGIGGFGNLRAHQRGAKHAAALKQRIEAAVYANRAEYIAQGVLDPDVELPRGEPVASGSTIKHRTPTKPRQDHPAPISHASTPRPSAVHIIRILRRLIHGINLAEDAPDSHPFARLGEASTGEVPAEQLWPEGEILGVIQQLFGPQVPDSTIESYVRRGVHGLDGFARWLRIHVHKRIEGPHLEPMLRLVDAIKTVAVRHGLTLPAIEDEPLPSRAPEPHAGPSHLPEPLVLPPPSAGEVDNSCPLCGPRYGTFKTPTDHYNHFGAHILFDSRVPLDACGFCLRPPSGGCIFYLRKDRTQLDYTRCTCPRMPQHLSYGPASRSIASSPCSNVPKICPLCPKGAPAVWKYHLQRHIITHHSVAYLEQFEHHWRVETFEIEGLRRIMHKAFIRSRRDMKELVEQDHVLNPIKLVAVPADGSNKEDAQPAATAAGPSRTPAPRPILLPPPPTNGAGQEVTVPAAATPPPAAPQPIRLNSPGEQSPPKGIAKKKRPTVEAPLPALFTRTMKTHPPPIALPQHPAIPIVPSQGQLPVPEIDRAYARQKRLREEGSVTPNGVDVHMDDAHEPSKRPRMTT